MATSNHDLAIPGSGPVRQPRAAAVDLNGLLAICRRRLPLFLAVAAVVFAIAVAYTLMQTPRYEATARVEVDARSKAVDAVDGVVDRYQPKDVGPETAGVVDTEVEVIRSQTLAEKVVAKLGLVKDVEFGGAGATIATTAASLMDAVDAHRAAETFLIDITARSTDAAKAARIADAFAQGYLQMQLDNKLAATQGATQALDSRVGEMAGQVEAAEAAVQQFKIRNGLMSVQGATLAEGSIATLDQQQAIARASQAEAEARLNTARAQLRNGSTGEDVGAALGSPVVQSLRATRAEASQQVADLSGRLGPQHPDLVKARARLADIDTQIQAEIRRVMNNLEADARVAQQRTGSLSSSAGQSRGALASNNRAQVELNALERRAEAIRALYSAYLTRSKQTQTQAGLEQADARIAALASVPLHPTLPRKAANLALGLVLAIAAGLSAALIATAFDSRLGTASDIERHLDLRALPSIPTLASTLTRAEARGAGSPVAYVVDHPASAFAESFRNLRASVRRGREGRPHQVIAMTSALPGEGKTTTSICLARVAALAGDRVVVVDCDFRRRASSAFSGNKTDTGLFEVLSGAAPLERALMRDEATGAMFLPIAKTETPTLDLFSSPAMLQLLGELRQRFDLVILDTAPVLPLADTRLLAALADRIVVLAQWRKTPRNAVESALAILDSADGHIAGASLTRVDLRKQAREGYGDPTFYHRQYQSYYAPAA